MLAADSLNAVSGAQRRTQARSSLVQHQQPVGIEGDAALDGLIGEATPVPGHRQPVPEASSRVFAPAALSAPRTRPAIGHWSYGASSSDQRPMAASPQSGPRRRRSPSGCPFAGRQAATGSTSRGSGAGGSRRQPRSIVLLRVFELGGGLQSFLRGAWQDDLAAVLFELRHRHCDVVLAHPEESSDADNGIRH